MSLNEPNAYFFQSASFSVPLRNCSHQDEFHEFVKSHSPRCSHRGSHRCAKPVGIRGTRFGVDVGGENSFGRGA